MPTAPEIAISPEIGRKTNGELIQRHARLLINSDPEFINSTNKLKTFAVRESIQKENPDIKVYGIGFGDDTIRKDINAIKTEIK